MLRLFESLFVCLFGFLTSSSTTRLYSARVPRQSVGQFYVLPACHTKTELGDHDFFLSRSHYTDTDPTSRERVFLKGRLCNNSVVCLPWQSSQAVLSSFPQRTRFSLEGERDQMRKMILNWFHLVDVISWKRLLQGAVPNCLLSLLEFLDCPLNHFLFLFCRISSKPQYINIYSILF